MGNPDNLVGDTSVTALFSFPAVVVHNRLGVLPSLHTYEMPHLLSFYA